VTEQYNDDPVINAGLSKIEAKAAFYDLAHGVITGKFDQNYTDWQKTQTISDDEIRSTPEIDDLVEWAHIDANLSELLSFKETAQRLLTEINLAIFGHYAKKNVRGTVPADTDLGAVRAELVKVLNGTVTMIEAGILEGMTVKMILDLPTVKKFGGRRDDGTWILPNAPSDKANGDAPNAPTGNLRSHNTQVKFVVNGALFECATLGEACNKLFGVTKPAEAAAMFDNWSSDYFAVGDETPKKAVERDGRRI